MPFRKITVAAEKAISGKDKVGGKKKEEQNIIQCGNRTIYSRTTTVQLRAIPCHITPTCELL